VARLALRRAHVSEESQASPRFAVLSTCARESGANKARCLASSALFSHSFRCLIYEPQAAGARAQTPDFIQFGWHRCIAAAEQDDGCRLGASPAIDSEPLPGQGEAWAHHRELRLIQSLSPCSALSHNWAAHSAAADERPQLDNLLILSHGLWRDKFCQ